MYKLEQYQRYMGFQQSSNFLKVYKESEPKVITEKTEFKLAMQRRRLKFVLRETIKRIIYFQTEVKKVFVIVVK